MKVQSINKQNIYSNCQTLTFKANPIMSMKCAFKRTSAPKRYFKISPFLEARQIFDNLWKELLLPEQLKPPVCFGNFRKSYIMGLDITNLCINVNCNKTSFGMHLRNKTGATKASFRHEIEHLQQVWLVTRYLGTENIAKKYKEETGEAPSAYKITYMKNVERTFGKIEPNSGEEILAKIYVDAIENYPEISEKATFNITGIIKDIIAGIKYYFNPLEQHARIAEKEYQPGILKLCAETIKEAYKIIKFYVSK